jgi:hypothetical protein
LGRAGAGIPDLLHGGTPAVQLPRERDPSNPELSVSVYDTNLTMVAHPNALLVGEDFRGRADVTGKAFGHEILARALANGRGPVTASTSSPAR